VDVNAHSRYHSQQFGRGECQRVVICFFDPRGHDVNFSVSFLVSQERNSTPQLVENSDSDGIDLGIAKCSSFEQ